MIRTKKERLCAVCGAPVTGKGKRRTCSAECLSRARSSRAAETNRQRSAAPEDEPRTCPVCGAPIPGDARRKTCSDACFRIYRAEQAAEMSRHKNLRRGSLPDAVIDREVARVRADWESDGSISDTDQTVYGNMITL